jgi:hypothetical protein
MSAGDGKLRKIPTRIRASYKERHGVKLGFMSFFVKAVVDALKAVPAVNAEIRGDQIVYRHYYDIGIAVGGGKGLVVPVLRNAEGSASPKSRSRSPTSGPAPRTTSSSSRSSRAARSASPTAASTARCSPRRSSTRPRAASSACTRIQDRPWRQRRRSDPPDDVRRADLRPPPRRRPRGRDVPQARQGAGIENPVRACCWKSDRVNQDEVTHDDSSRHRSTGTPTTWS